MAVLEKQISTICDVAEQLIIIKSELAKNHHDESQKFEQEYQQLVRATFDISHRQDIDSLNRGFIHNTGAGPWAGPQLPVLALKPDCHSYLMSTADQCI